MLHSIPEVQDKIRAGACLLLAGSEEALSRLPKGNWIGGTIPYFMDRNGGVCSETDVFVTEVPDAISAQPRRYSATDLPSICKDAPENGFSFVIIPAGSAIHVAYAQNAPDYEGIFIKPVVGWISGVKVNEIGKRLPKVFFGPDGTTSSDNAALVHFALARNQMAQLEIVNVFQPGAGDRIAFPVAGFAASECSVNGKTANFAHYLSDLQHDIRIPLVADYNGSCVNVSLQSIDLAQGVVKFYAPVFPNVLYRLAKPVPDYMAAFASAVPRGDTSSVFSCNCILNYLYAGLEGKRTGSYTGPITFGEIAHQLLNQTLVTLAIRWVG